VSLDLPGHQEWLLRAVQAAGKPTVLVLSNGRPLSVNWAARHVPAILTVWFPGENAGTALADVLFGDVNPSGHLPVTFPRSVGQIQLNFPAKPGSQAKDPGQVEGPLYPFGHGLSYTTFGYAKLAIEPGAQGPRGSVTVACEVTNTGSRAGHEVVQLYLRDDFSTVITPEKVLRGFERVPLAPGETKTVQFVLEPEHLELYDRDGNWVVEPGRFTVMVGDSSDSIKLEGSFDIDDGSTAREREAATKSLDDPT
jgi:beta-glucosidase